MRLAVFLCVCVALFLRMYCAWHAVLQIHLPARFEGVPINATVKLIKLQSVARYKVRFVAALVPAKSVGREPGSNGDNRVMLSSFGAHPHLQVGQVYQLTIKLRDLRSLYTAEAQGYKHWLMANHIAFVGYVVRRDWRLLSKAKRDDLAQLRNQVLNAWMMVYGSRTGTACTRRDLKVEPWHSAPSCLESLDKRMARPRFYSGNMKADVTFSQLRALSQQFLIALTTGNRAYVSKKLWNILRGTGTSHLVAISGLHLGLLALIGYYLFAWGVRLLPWVLLYLPAQRFGQFGALSFATFFAMLSGWSIPTERAWLMLLVFTLTQWCYLAIKPWQSLLCAAVALLFWHPLAVLSVSFWLSVIAVGSVLLAVATTPKHKSKVWQWCYFQTCITVFLLPITWFYFSFVASNAFWANLVAVPAVTLVILPGAIAAQFWHALLQPVSWLTMQLLMGLQWLSLHLPIITWYLGAIWMIASYIVLILLIWWGWWQRFWWLGLLLTALLLPVYSYIYSIKH